MQPPASSKVGTLFFFNPWFRTRRGTRLMTPDLYFVWSLDPKGHHSSKKFLFLYASSTPASSSILCWPMSFLFGSQVFLVSPARSSCVSGLWDQTVPGSRVRLPQTTFLISLNLSFLMHELGAANTTLPRLPLWLDTRLRAQRLPVYSVCSTRGTIFWQNCAQ